MNLLSSRFAQTPSDRGRYRNSMIGLAAGDAWGYQVEFTTFSRMRAHPTPAPATIWTVSDDTQMALALHDALTDLTPADLGDARIVDTAIINRFLDWQADPDNYRAPGTTCMGSLDNIGEGTPWFSKDGAMVSRGCGAVMRVAPAAFLDDKHWAGIAALQAIITHNHPAAAVSALLVASAIRYARENAGRYVIDALATISAIYDGTHEWCHDEFLAQVLTPVLIRSNGDIKTVQEYLIEGLTMNGTHDRVAGALGANGQAPGGSLFDVIMTANEVEFSYLKMPADLLLAEVDPCRRVGQGWNSPTATALALLVADMGTEGPLTPKTALAWASTSNGDSDSIAAISGAILGALSDQEDFWEQEGLTPTFEPRYARALAGLPEPTMPLGEYPADAGGRMASRTLIFDEHIDTLADAHIASQDPWIGGTGFDGAIDESLSGPATEDFAAVAGIDDVEWGGHLHRIGR